MPRATIHVDMDQKCERCGRPGVTGTEKGAGRFCLSCVAKQIKRPYDFSMNAKLKNLKTKPYEKSDDEVVFSFVFETDAGISEAERMLAQGAAMLDQNLFLTFEGHGSGFERTVRDAELVRVAGVATEEATVRLSIEFAMKTDLDGMRLLWADFLPQRSYSLMVSGVVQKAQTVMSFPVAEPADE